MDYLASQLHYADHMLPVWGADVSRGTFWVADEAMAVALRAKLLPYLDPCILPLPGGTFRLPAPVLVASGVDVARARRLAAPAMAYMEHGCGQSYGGDRSMGRHPAYAGGGGRERCGLILAPNESSARRWRERYPTVPVHVIGATRVLTPPEDSRRSTLAVSFHWPGPIPELQPAWPHYASALAELARTREVIGHAHPRVATTMGRGFARLGIRFVPDLAEVARIATVYAVDNSSTLWELGRTRPTIALNAPWYRRSVNHGLRFWSHAGVQADSGADLARTAARYLDGQETDEERGERERICAEVIPSLDGAAEAARLLAAWSAR